MTELESGPRPSPEFLPMDQTAVSNQGVRGQSPYPAGEEEVALPCPRSLILGVHLLQCFGTTRPAFLGMLTVHLWCQRFMCKQPSSAFPSPHCLMNSGCF